MKSGLAVLLGTVTTSTLEFEYKEATPGVQEKINRTTCAMANDLINQGGGDILVEVSDNGTVVGNVDTSDAVLLKLSDIRNQAKIFHSHRLLSPEHIRR